MTRWELDGIGVGPTMVEREKLRERYRDVRDASLELVEPLSVEDQCVQPMPDASPTKWHLGHTTWFFETVILGALSADYRCVDERFRYLFNSYYESLGPRQPRPQRGQITRPGLDEVLHYREAVDDRVAGFIARCGERTWAKAGPLLELGLAHEQQHQELILTDIKYALGVQRFDPVYRPAETRQDGRIVPLEWRDFTGGKAEVGSALEAGFAYDNERPRHPVWLQPYRLANRAVNCGEYLAFIADGGYERPEFWLSDGWAAVCTHGWRAPLYWREDERDTWSLFTLHGRKPLDPLEPVCHVSLYEAAAYAAWADARLPTEFEWEAAVGGRAVTGRFADGGCLHPRAPEPSDGLLQVFGDVWEWTRSSYDPYPGFAPLPGALTEYNGKFMVGQLVLRGGSCATPAGHVRATYRNFFPPDARWQFTGIRLARDAA